MDEHDDLTIGELAARFGLATHVLRYWEAMGVPGAALPGRRRLRPRLKGRCRRACATADC